MASLPTSSSSSSSSQPKTLTKPSNSQSRWQSDSQERLYRTRLIDALEAARQKSESPVGSRAIKQAADSALALTARGRSRWSRAILLSRHSCQRRKVVVKSNGKTLRSKKNKIKIKNQARVCKSGSGSGSGSGEKEKEEEEEIEERLRRLGKIVPGCKQLATANLLDEVVDYVVALELQVRTMKALEEALAAARVSGDDVAGEERS